MNLWTTVWLKRSAVALVAMLCAPAWAQIWGYADRNGANHLADRPVDGRHGLFYKESMGGAGMRGPADKARNAVWASPRVSASVEVSTRYKAVRHLVKEAAKTCGSECERLKVMIATESGFNSHAVSPKGAVGLMQLMPETAQRVGVKARSNQTREQRLTDPRANLHAGAHCLAWLLSRFGGKTQRALAAYNAGEGAARRAGRQVPNNDRETQSCVHKVMRLHQELRPPRAVREQRAAPPAPMTGPAIARPL